ncbi:MAG: hypothetical protein ACI9UU_003855 [Candidatus Azotimanducaceae bacterium]|jgi:hypothetical protein
MLLKKSAPFWFLWFAVLGGGLGAERSSAQVTHASEFGFVSEHELILTATPAESYSAFVHEIASWWDANHSYSGQAQAFRIEDKAGGCFCETTGDVEVQHMRVVNVARGRSLTMVGGLGPLQAMAVQGSMSFNFLPHADGTRLVYEYHVGGYLPGGLAPLAEPVDRVQLSQLKRLQNFLISK